MKAFKRENQGGKKIKSNPFFQPGRGRFNISITFNSTAEVIPGRGVGGVCSWLGVPDEYPRAMTAEVIPGRRIGGIFPLEASERIGIFFLSAFGNIAYLCTG